MFDQHKCTIGETDYIINPFKGRQGIKLSAKLMKFATPALMAIKEIPDDAEQAAMIGGVIHAILANTDEDSVLSLIEELLAGVYKGTQKVDLDKEFTCNYSAAFHLLKEVVMFNFKDVFSQLGIDSK
jgi:hypothetical protein